MRNLSQFRFHKNTILPNGKKFQPEPKSLSETIRQDLSTKYQNENNDLWDKNWKNEQVTEHAISLLRKTFRDNLQSKIDSIEEMIQQKNDISVLNAK